MWWSDQRKEHFPPKGPTPVWEGWILLPILMYAIGLCRKQCGHSVVGNLELKSRYRNLEPSTVCWWLCTHDLLCWDWHLVFTREWELKLFVFLCLSHFTPQCLHIYLCCWRGQDFLFFCLTTVPLHTHRCACMYKCRNIYVHMFYVCIHVHLTLSSCWWAPWLMAYLDLCEDCCVGAGFRYSVSLSFSTMHSVVRL